MTALPRTCIGLLLPFARLQENTDQAALSNFSRVVRAITDGSP